MATLTVQTPSQTSGLLPSFTAANSSDAIPFDPDQRTYLHVKNGGGSSITVTITAQTTSSNIPGLGAGTIANMSSAVAAGAERIFGPFPQAFADGNGLVQVGYSGVTSVTAAAVRLPRV